MNGNLVGVGDPGLAPLGDYGGLTETMALLPGSPAIDAGTSGAGIPTTDQRGLPRVGQVNIGSVENQGYTLSVVADRHPAVNVHRHGVRLSARRDPDIEQPSRPLRAGHRLRHLRRRPRNRRGLGHTLGRLGRIPR